MPIVHVVDSIMGSGKTTSAINFICSQGGEKFIYAAPYLDEAHRIALACSGRDFYEPPGDGGSEEEHIAKWPHFDFATKGGKNIATTHALVKNVMVWHHDVIEIVAKQSYNIIFDESPDLFSEFEQHTQDIAVLTEANRISADEHRCVHWNSREKYLGDAYEALYSAITNGCVRAFVDENGKIESLFSAVPLDLFRQAKDVFILTYLWEASITCAYLKSEGIDYDYWYIDSSGDAKMLTPEEQPFVPSVGIRELIRFDCGRNDSAKRHGKAYLSFSWYEHASKELLSELGKAARLFARRSFQNGREYIYTTFKDFADAISSNSMKKHFVACNRRASNEFGDATAVGYFVNRYMNPNINKYFGQFGVSVPDNAYGLSEMVQFIWRSAIRNGEMIYLFIPAARMYNILMDWLSVIEGCPDFRRIGCSEELIRWLCRKIPGYGKFLAEKASATNGEETVMVTLPLPATATVI